MQHQSPSPDEFSIGQARGIVKDLFGANPAIYWTDFLLSMGVGTFCFVAIRRGRLFDRICDAMQWEWFGYRWAMIGVFFAISCLAYYRAALFTHELVHLRDGAVRGFRMVWNALCGIPFLMPAFLYDTHVHHHIRKHYATAEDGEYLPLAVGPARNILWYLAQSFVIPLLAVLRFAVVTPLTWFSPRLREWVYRRASSMVIDPTYIRPLPTRKQRRAWRLCEAACFAYVWTLGVCLALRLLPWMWLVHVYAMGVTIIMLNSLRTLGAHRYWHAGGEVSFLDQLLDSVNYPRHPLVGELWAPVGLRFHALHHLFPSLPYHALAEAHRRLMTQLPADSPYRQTESPGLWSSLRVLSRRASSHGMRDDPPKPARRRETSSNLEDRSTSMTTLPRA